MKYIAYCRKSTDEKDKQVLSIEAQIAELKEFARRENLELVDFITEAKTAKSPGREQFKLILERIEKGEAQGIVSWHPDRLARNSIDGGKIIYLLDTGKLLDLKFPSFWFENTPQGKFMLSIAFGQSKYYVDNLSENVKRGNRQKLRRGELPGKAPYGYINNRQTRSIDIDPETSRTIRRAFEFFAEGGHSFTEVSLFMAKFALTRANGRPLHLNQIRRTFTNKFYVGIIKYAGEYYVGTHKTFISKELFARVAREISRIEKPRQKGHNFALTGIARCGECQAAITAEQHIKKYQNGTSQTFIYYRCTKKPNPCTQKYVPEENFAEQLKKIVWDCALHKDYEEIFEKWAEVELEKERTNSEEILNLAEEKLAQSDEKLNKLLDAYLEGVIDSDIYKTKKNELFEEKLKIQEEISKIKRMGSSWLEPMREIMQSSIACFKTARAKNNYDELKFISKTVGSNYSLLDRRLSVEYKNSFKILAAFGGAAKNPPSKSTISLFVSRQGLEP